MIEVAGIKHWIGNSSEPKPTEDVKRGSVFEESDTGNEYRWKGDGWFLAIPGNANVTKSDFSDMFGEITRQLKIANIHLASMSNETINPVDIE